MLKDPRRADYDDDDGFLAHVECEAALASGGGVVTSVVAHKPPSWDAERDAHTATGRWCRPIMLLLLLVLLLVIFVLISGILLYYNYLTYKPISSTIEDFTYKQPPPAQVDDIFEESTKKPPEELCVETETQDCSMGPVCGSDGVTYNSLCALRFKACNHADGTKLRTFGECDPCDGFHCSHPEVCQLDANRNPICRCKDTCSLELSPVCASDGKTYSNECTLRQEACRSDKFLTIVHHGMCAQDSCDNHKCNYYSVCQTDSRGNPRCLCPNNRCEEDRSSICGSDGITYRNICELKKSACQKQVSIHLKYNFSCEILHTPITETQLMVSNSCDDYICEFGASCLIGLDNSPYCKCQFNCSPEDSPVCASNIKVYPSLCVMKMNACELKQELRLRPMDLCHGLKITPCNGNQPLINPDSGNVYDCGSGPNRQDCPTGSYCHHTVHFSRCCRKVDPIKENSCESSTFGCCPDGKTLAQGPNNTGCPFHCSCNKLGAYSDTCDHETKQCLCKPGVGGLKCDRCEPGFWGLPKISEGINGCTSCSCSPYGSVREDCEQMTGRCMCKPGVQGQKCTVCNGLNMILGPDGCIPDNS